MQRSASEESSVLEREQNLRKTILFCLRIIFTRFFAVHKNKWLTYLQERVIASRFVFNTVSRSQMRDSSRSRYGHVLNALKKLFAKA